MASPNTLTSQSCNPLRRYRNRHCSILRSTRCRSHNHHLSTGRAAPTDTPHFCNRTCLGLWLRVSASEGHLQDGVASEQCAWCRSTPKQLSHGRLPPPRCARVHPAATSLARIDHEHSSRCHLPQNPLSSGGAPAQPSAQRSAPPAPRKHRVVHSRDTTSRHRYRSHTQACASERARSTAHDAPRSARQHRVPLRSSRRDPPQAMPPDRATSDLSARHPP